MIQDLIRQLNFEPFHIDHLVDPRKRYRLELSPQFPFMIKLFSYDSLAPPYPLNWHERLELFVPLSGTGVFVMGDQRIRFSAGDVLVTDNLKLHGLGEFAGPSRLAMVITFLPEFVCPIGATRADAVFLAPFYGQAGEASLVSAKDPLAHRLHEVLGRLASCYSQASGEATQQAQCKVYLLEVLLMLASKVGGLQGASAMRSESMRCQEEARLLGTLHSYLLEHFADRIAVSEAAALVGMSDSSFMRYFRRATGTTFVSYLTRLRLNRAAQLIVETNRSIAEIATETGFSDQSYFDRVFRRHFSSTPREMRLRR